MNRELTDAEVDKLLERFDQTEPHLQRRIIAAFVAKATKGQDRVEQLEGCLHRVVKYSQVGIANDQEAGRDASDHIRVLEMAREALTPQSADATRRAP